MEGQTPKIRTMAGDLGEVKKSLPARNVPKESTVLYPPKEHEAAEKNAAFPHPSKKARGEALQYIEKGEKMREIETLQEASKQRPRIEPPQIRTKPASTNVTQDKGLLYQKEERQKADKEGGESLAEILKSARERVIERAQAGKEPGESTGLYPPKESELLPIEETEETKKEDAKMSEPEYRKPPAPIEPPSNLPTGEPSFIMPLKESERTVAPPPPKKEAGPALPSEKEVGLKAQFTPPEQQMGKPAKETPEEILGLSAIPRQERAEAKPEREKTAPSPAAPEITERVAPIKERGGGLTKKRKIPALKFALITIALGAGLAGIVAGVYFSMLSGKEVKEGEGKITAPSVAVQPEPPPLIRYDNANVIEIDSLSPETLQAAINNLNNLAFLEGQIIYIPVKYSSQTSVSYLTFDEIAHILDIPVPPPLLNKSTDEFNMFLYIQGAEERKECELAGIISRNCYAPRIGIIFDASKEEAAIADIMLRWENTLAYDLSPLILSEFIPDGTFNNGEYKGLATRYLNLRLNEGGNKSATTSIDWIIADSKLIVATSKNAARVAVDNLISN